MNPMHANAELSDELLLGHIAWYTITKPRVTQEELVELIGNLGLHPSIVPQAPRPGDAFKRACRYSERTGLPHGDNKANFLIRNVATTAEDIERWLVLELVDPEDRVLSHTDVAHLKFDRINGVLHIDQQEMADASLKGMVQETIDGFVKNLEEAIKTVDAQVIRRMLREQLELLNAISLRRHGSVYFIPARYFNKVEALEEFCTHMGDGSQFVAIPLPDASKHREMLSNAFEEELHVESTQSISELKGFLLHNTEITPRAFAEYKSRLDALKARAEEYGTLVEVEVFKSSIELKAYEQQLTKILVNGLIKAGRGKDK